MAPILTMGMMIVDKVKNLDRKLGKQVRTLAYAWRLSALYVQSIHKIPRNLPDVRSGECKVSNTGVSARAMVKELTSMPQPVAR